MKYISWQENMGTTPNPNMENFMSLVYKISVFSVFQNCDYITYEVKTLFLPLGTEPWVPSTTASTIKSLYSFVVNFMFPCEYGFPLNILVGTLCHQIIFLMNLLCMVLLQIRLDITGHFQLLLYFSKWFKHGSYIILVSEFLGSMIQLFIFLPIATFFCSHFIVCVCVCVCVCVHTCTVTSWPHV